MLHHSVRAGLEIEIEDFGRNRVAEAASRLHRQRGLGAYTDDALEEMLVALRADADLAARLKAENRALRDGEISPETGRHVIHVNSFDEMVSCVAEHFGVLLPTAEGR